MYYNDIELNDSLLSQPSKTIDETMSHESQKNRSTSQEEEKGRGQILSRMNSMECWDYSIELECLNGPPG
jgi:hypothetical protein